ncbi:MAG: MHYT domain-containing protein [Pseudomonadota bacterium]
MLEVSHNYWLVAASLMVAMMAGFTGLSLAQGASALPLPRRKSVVAMASIALGGGIWSMHFVAMLGLQLPILFYYDALITLISALVAILVVGLALLILHFRKRTRVTLTLAGALVGLGIVAMHYLGMSGMQLCRAVHTPLGVIVALGSSLTLSVGAIWIAYGVRTHRNIILGTLCFGAAVFAVHFVAMFGASFTTEGVASAGAASIGNEALAIVVALSTFVICGAFLLSGVTFLPAAPAREADVGSQAEPPAAVPTDDEPAEAPAPHDAPAPLFARQVPYEKDGRTFFIDPGAIAAVRAEGHYTILYAAEGKLFCPWSISEAVKRLPEPAFIRAHRSYLINPAHVSGFERRKDNGLCFFADLLSLDSVPVSRSRLPAVRDALGI